MWLYHRFPRSYREAEELLPARGVIVSQETVRQWCATFGPAYARGRRRRRARPGDTGHRNAVSVTINGEWRYLWRAVDHDGTVRDILVPSRRTITAAQRFPCRRC
nr:DDE-type integrase/transposase/recombinase [Frankia sp. CiP3]